MRETSRARFLDTEWTEGYCGTLYQTVSEPPVWLVDLLQGAFKFMRFVEHLRKFSHGVSKALWEAAAKVDPLTIHPSKPILHVSAGVVEN